MKLIIIAGILFIGVIGTFAFMNMKKDEGYVKTYETPKEEFTNELVDEDRQKKRNVVIKDKDEEKEEKVSYVPKLNPPRFPEKPKKLPPFNQKQAEVKEQNFSQKIVEAKTISFNRVGSTGKDTTTHHRSDKWMPSHRLIKCRTVSTIDSRHSSSPLIAIITEDYYHHGNLIIPKNTEIHGMLGGSRQNNRVHPATSWRMILTGEEHNGKEMTFTAKTLFRAEQYSENKSLELSAGMIGTVKQSNPDELKELMILTGLQGGLEALEEQETNAFGNTNNTNSLQNAAINSVTEPIDRWINQRFDQIGSDPYYVEVLGGTAFYLYTLTPLDLSKAKLAAVK